MRVSRLAHTPRMAQLLIGYARCGSASEDQVAERAALAAAGVGQGRIYTDVGLRGTTRPRPGLAQAMAAGRAGDTLVVVSLDRLARSVPDAAEVVAGLTGRGVVLQVGGCCFGPGDPLCRVLAMVAEFQRALVRGRTTEGMRMARVAGRLKGRPPKLSAASPRCTWCSPSTSASTPRLRSLNCWRLAARRSTGRCIERKGPSGRGQHEGVGRCRSATLGRARRQPVPVAVRRRAGGGVLSAGTSHVVVRHFTRRVAPPRALRAPVTKVVSAVPARSE